MLLKRLVALGIVLLSLPISSYATLLTTGKYTFNTDGSITIQTDYELASLDSELESFLLLDSGSIDTLVKSTSQDATYGSAITDTVDIHAEDTFSFDWLWNSNENDNQTLFNDFAFVTISLDDVLQQTWYLADTYTADNTRGSFSWTADDSGKLTYGVAILDVTDNSGSSFFTVSNVSVPEPPTLSIFALGLLLISGGWFKSRNSRKNQQNVTGVLAG